MKKLISYLCTTSYKLKVKNKKISLNNLGPGLDSGVSTKAENGYMQSKTHIL